MDAADVVKLDTNVVVEAVDTSTGEVVHREEVHNLVTLNGRNLIRDLLYTASTLSLTHIGVGTGTTAAASGDTALGTERARIQIVKFTTGSGSLTVTGFLNSATANGYTLTEAGIFTASSAGTLFARAVHTGIAKSASIAVNYTWTISIAAS